MKMWRLLLPVSTSAAFLGIACSAITERRLRRNDYCALNLLHALKKCRRVQTDQRPSVIHAVP